jgi:type IV pilus assembly protein PilA
MRNQRHEAGFTLTELLIVLAVIGIVAAMATVRLDRARIAANESSGIGSLRAINSAESTYASSCGGSGFAQSLEDLSKPPASSSHGFVSADLARNGVVKSGYTLVIEADADAAVVAPAAEACNAPAEPVVSSYFTSANPQSAGRTGERTFASDKRGTIYMRTDGEPIEPGMSGGVALQ